MKYLIAGLGNPGKEYELTRHNIGFMVLDAFAEASNFIFEPGRYADVAKHRIKNKEFIFIKPSTYMNLSGKAVRYWKDELKIELDNTLVITDDLALPTGKLRLKGKGSAGGHNGLQNIEDLIGTNQYPRLRFGVGNDFPKGQQVNHVLGNWTEEEVKIIEPKISLSIEIIKSFAFEGLQRAMSRYNNN